MGFKHKKANKKRRIPRNVNNADPVFRDNVLGVLVYRFPAKSNTFIVNELVELVNRGIDIHIYSIGTPSEEECDLFQKEIDLIGGENITYLNKSGMFKWANSGVNNIPLSNNPIRMSLKNAKPWMIQQVEVVGIENSLPLVCEIIDHMTATGVDALYSPFANLGAELCLMIARHMDIPLSFTCHSHDLFCMDGYNILKMERASRIFVVSEYNKKFIADNYNVDPDKIVVKRVNFIADSECSDHDFDFEYILGVGRLIDMKGFNYTLEAFKEIVDECPDLHYVIAGSGANDEALKELTETLGIEDRVHFTGYVSNDKIVGLVKDATFSILSSIVSDNGDMEGLPTFFLESMSQGVPCIGTNYSGIPELIENGVTGMLTEMADVEGISNAMLSIYSQMHSEESNVIRENCIEKIKDIFDNEKNIDLFIKEIGDMRYDYIN